MACGAMSHTYFKVTRANLLCATENTTSIIISINVVRIQGEMYIMSACGLNIFHQKQSLFQVFSTLVYSSNNHQCISRLLHPLPSWLMLLSWLLPLLAIAPTFKSDVKPTPIAMAIISVNAISVFRLLLLARFLLLPRARSLLLLPALRLRVLQSQLLVV